MNPAGLIDHTLLKPDAQPAQIKQLCTEACEYRFWSVCVNSCWLPLCRRLLEGTEVRVGTVVGFPLGAALREAKAAEAALAVKLGADELDMVVNIGWLKAGEDRLVLADIRAVVDAAPGRVVKVILETCLLTSEEKERAARLAVEAGAQFVKTSTGFSSGGATPEDVKLLRRTVGPEFGVKAAGGISDLATLEAMVRAGANRIGTSSGVAIVKAAKVER
uniref:Deoxyribose-phosphate aldolase n=1 Tax=candidate division WOR-3 bacterium TaxID=2052148 RepID=A0A7C4CBH9_UNCW3